MSLLTAGGVGWLTSEGPFQPKAFYDSMTARKARMMPEEDHKNHLVHESRGSYWS